MKKIILTIIIVTLSFTIATSDEIDCNQFEKISAKFLECKAKNIKGKSKELKLKAVVEAEELKKKVVKNAKKNKKKYNKSILKQKLIKFKNSKTLTKFMEK